MRGKARLTRLEQAIGVHRGRADRMPRNLERLIARLTADGAEYAARGRFVAWARLVAMAAAQDGEAGAAEFVLALERELRHAVETCPAAMLLHEGYLLDQHLVNGDEAAELERWRDEHGPDCHPLRDDDLAFLRRVFGDAASITIATDHAWRPGRVEIRRDGVLLGDGRTSGDAFTSGTQHAEWQRHIRDRVTLATAS